jgi:peptidoglycan/xylan/chitin deacetylase (PgdA/CDA1 family)
MFAIAFTVLASILSALVALQLSMPKLIRSVANNCYPKLNFFRTDEVRKRCAITIDDAVTPEVTGQLIDLLEREEYKHHRVTFFCIGERASENFGTFRRLESTRHEIGHHDWANHSSRSSWQRGRFQDDFGHTESVIGRRRWFRPGKAWWTNAMVDWVRARNYRLALADVYSNDPFLPFPRYHAWFLRRNLRPGSVAVYHDNRSYSVETVRRALDVLNERGYESVTLSELFEE